MKKKVIRDFLIITLTFIIAFTLGRITDWSVFVFSRKISLVDILTFLVTIWLAYFVAQVLEKDIQNRQMGKQMLIDRLRDSEEFLKRINSLLGNDTNPYTQMVNSIDRYLSKKNVTLDSIKDHKEENRELENQISNIRNKGAELRVLLTDTPEDREDQSNIIMTKGEIRYANNRKRELSSCFGLLGNAIFDLKYSINSI